MGVNNKTIFDLFDCDENEEKMENQEENNEG